MNIIIVCLLLWCAIVLIGISFICASEKKTDKIRKNMDKDLEKLKSEVRKAKTFDDLREAYRLYLSFVETYNVVCDRKTCNMLSFYHGIIVARAVYEFKKVL